MNTEITDLDIRNCSHIYCQPAVNTHKKRLLQWLTETDKYQVYTDGSEMAMKGNKTHTHCSPIFIYSDFFPYC